VSRIFPGLCTPPPDGLSESKWFDEVAARLVLKPDGKVKLSRQVPAIVSLALAK